MKIDLELAKFLIKQRVIGFNVPDLPHMDDEGSALFRELLGKARLYMEFGTGGSTLEAVRAGVDIVAVESDPYWAKAVRKKMGDRANAVLLDAPIGLTGPWGRPFFEKPTESRVKRWMRYTMVAFDYIAVHNKPFPDLIFIDGRFRRACALDSAARAQGCGAETTIVLDDYIERPHYHSLTEFLGEPEMCGRSAIFRTPLPAGLKPITPEVIYQEFHDPD